jgi:hypothetical protein
MNYNNISLVNQPVKIKIKLFRHQLASIYNMENLECQKVIVTNNCIIQTTLGINSDIAGYGKTYSMLGLIARDKMFWDISSPFIKEKVNIESNGIIKKIYNERYTKLPTTLILVSSTILKQWENEILNTELKFTTVINKKDINNIIVENYDIILVIPSMYNNLIKSYSNYAWKRFIFDEPGNLRVSGMRDINCGFIWFVTANPNSIIPYHQSCRGSFMFKIIGNNKYQTFEEQFSDIILKNNDLFVKESFNMPQTNYIDYYCFQPILKIIDGMVNPVITKLIETGNISGAIDALGGSKTKNIIELVKNKKQEEIEIIKSKLNIHNIRKNNQRIEHYNKILVKLENELNTIEDRFKNILNEYQCHICLNNVSNIVMEPNCQNLFCGECLLKWLNNNNTCPLCRNNVNLSELIYIDNNETKIDQQLSSKILLKTEQIIDIIKSNKKGRFLIFSDFEGSFKPICQILNDNNINFLILKGDVLQRTSIIDTYKNNIVNVIFINSSKDCAGINLPETTDIILYHQMSDNNKSQIISRAERIGRTEVLNIHQLLVHI